MNASSAIATVGDISLQVRGISYDKADASAEPSAGLVGLLRANNIVEDELVLDDLLYIPARYVNERQWLRPNDVLIAASSGSLSAVGKSGTLLDVDFAGTFGAFCKVLRPDTSRVDPRYFSHFFRTPDYRRTISSLAAGANISNLKNEHLDNLVISLPPLDEQRRIAAILDQADALRQKRKRAIALLDRLTQSIFLEMFGDPLSNPRSLRLSRVGDLLARSPNFGSMKPPQPLPLEWLSLRVANIQDWALDLGDRKYIDLDEAELERFTLQDGDIVLARAIASQEHLGKCVVVEPRADRWAFDSHLMRIRLDPDRMEPVYLREMFRTPGGRALFLRSTRKTTVQYNINTKELSALVVPVPTIGQQREFVSRVAVIGDIRRRANKMMEEFSALFTSLQHRAFSGQL